MLDVIGVSWSADGESILDGVSMQVPTGNTTAVLGPSGSGKTTLLRIIAGLQRPASGDIRWDGESIVTTPTHRRDFGLMFQDYALFPHRTVADNVGFGLEVTNVEDQERRRRVAEALDLVGMAEFAHRDIESLSGGEQQRVALARALAPRPRLLMFDEPLGSLDRSLREHLVGEIRTILAGHTMTAIYVTHDQDEAFSVADQIVLLDDGRVAGRGIPERLWNDPETSWTARFLGFTNIIQVTDGRWGKLEVPGVPDGAAFIRRNAIHLDPFGPLTGTVSTAVFSGGHFLLEVDTPDGVLELESDSNPGSGAPVTMSVDPGGVTPLAD